VMTTGWVAKTTYSSPTMLRGHHPSCWRVTSTTCWYTKESGVGNPLCWQQKTSIILQIAKVELKLEFIIPFI
jgi:hypothetical protein